LHEDDDATRWKKKNISFKENKSAYFLDRKKNARIFNLSFSYQLQKAKYDITFLIVVASRIWLSKYETKY
jgi:hypothetical protein